jgi:mono/diheme cytochrome c family protein
MKRLALLLALASLAAVAPARADDGRQMYGKKCLACHGLDGAGDKPLGKKLKVPDIRNTRLSLAEIEKVIADGRGAMLGYRDRLTAEQITELATHVKEGLKQPTP